MSGVVYLNGNYVDADKAVVSAFDRGFLMADAVYEVTAALDGKLVDFNAHMARLDRSLSELDYTVRLDRDQLLEAHRQIVSRNNITHGLIYMQITRGSAGERLFTFPDPKKVPPTIFICVRSKFDLSRNPGFEKGIRVITVPDQRWLRCDIKTTQLLSASLAKMAAKAAGADDAWFVEGTEVTEGSSNNAYIVRGKTVITREPSHRILNGITRTALVAAAAKAGLTVEERRFTVAEAKEADEAFITSASDFVMPVVSVDGVTIGQGTPGPITRLMQELYVAEATARLI